MYVSMRMCARVCMREPGVGVILVPELVLKLLGEQPAVAVVRVETPTDL